MAVINKKIAINSRRHPNMGEVAESTVDEYEKLARESWLKNTLDAIHSTMSDETLSKEDKEKRIKSLKHDLPIRAAHYYGFRDNHRTQKDADPEKFTFQTVVDVDDPQYVAYAIKKSQEMDKDTTSPWYGLLRGLEYSAQKKLHIDILMPVGMTIEETQRKYCDALSIPFDESCITPERAIYIVDERQIIYRHPEWQKVFEGEELKARQQAFLDRGLTIDGRCPSAEKAPSTENAASESDCNLTKTAENQVATKASLYCFDNCVELAGLQLEQLDSEGKRHFNLQSVLSVGLLKILPKAQVEACIKERMPSYYAADTADCRTLIDYFYQNYSADKGFINPRLRGILAESQKIGNATDKADAKEEEDDAFFKNFNPPKAPTKLTRLHELIVKNYDVRFREQLLLSAQVALAGMTDHFRVEQVDGDITTGAADIVVLGLSGSGKKNITDCFHMMVKNTIQASDDLEWARLRENAELREQKKNSKDCPKKYHPAIRIFSKASTSSLQEMQTNLQEGMSIGVYSEGDTLVRASNAAWSDLSTYFRVGWDHDKQPQIYMSDNSCNSNTELSISLLCLGTPRVILSGLMKDSNVENGLLQRCQIVPMPTQISFHAPKKNLLSSDEKKELDGLLLQLWQKNLSLGDGTLIIETPKMHKIVEKFESRLEQDYNEGLLTTAEAQLSHRIGQFMVRAALPLIVLYGEETPEILAYAQWIGEYSYYTTCFLFGRRVQDAIDESRKMMNVSQDGRRTAQPILDSMPDIFNIKQFKEARIQAGQSDSCKMLLHNYVKSGKLERIARGVYRKCAK